MALIKALRGKTPSIGEDCFIAENAVIIGDVTIGSQSSIWYGAVLRGDVNSIIIGNKCNIQDGAVLHCTFEKTVLNLGNQVSIGHRAIIHGCTIEDDVLVGMGAIVMDGAIVPSKCLIAAGAVVTEGAVLESEMVYAGVPARPIKPLSKDLSQNEIARIAGNYLKYSSWYR